MIKRYPDSTRSSVIDGMVALAITSFVVIPSKNRVLDLHNFGDTNGLFDVLTGFLFIVAWSYCFTAFDLYGKIATMPSRLGSILKAILCMLVLTAGYLAAFHRDFLSIRRVALLLVILCAYEIARIFLTVQFLDILAARDPRRAIILGSGRRAGKAWREIRTRYHSSITLLGFVDDRDPELMAPEVASRYIGAIDELGETLLKEAVDIILIAMPIQSCYPLMQRAIDIAEGVGISVIYLGDIYSSRKVIQVSNETLFRELVPQQDHYLVQLATKRLIDLVGASIALLALSPLLLAIAIGVKMTSRGPVLFQQKRYGHRRRIFPMLKFRSMVHNAEGMLSALEHANEAEGPIFKMKLDPRTTSFGRFLRKTSLDELPQLWNVLKGEMSLVGPRPMSIRDVALFDHANLMRRFSVKPGMTGLWQVSGRSQVSFSQWIALDNRYIDEWSLIMDLRILLRTVNVVFRRSGAV